MVRVLFSIVAGLVGAAILHIVIILALPQFTGKDAYSRVLSLFEMDSFFSLTNEPGQTGLYNEDPFLRTAVCAFSVSSGPARFVARGRVPFWSLAIYDENSNEVFSMNDQTAVNGNLDLIIATPIQLVELRKTASPDLAQSIMVEMSGEDGYAVLRALAPTASYEETARNFLSESSCEQLSR